MKQSAVEWLAQQLGITSGSMLEQAKQIEKEEQDKIYDHAFKYGQLSAPELSDFEIEKSAQILQEDYKRVGITIEISTVIISMQWYREQLKQRQ